MTSTTWRRWWLPVFILTLSGLFQFAIPVTSTWLRFQPDAISSGELWRLLSGHLVHLSWGHFLMNGIAFLAICGLYKPWLTPGMLSWWMLVSALTVDFGLRWFDPQLDWYVGLSGVLHGLLVAGSLHQILRREPVGFVVLAAVVLKLAWEQAYGPMPGSEATAGGRVIVNAHVYGAIGGCVATAGEQLRSYWRSRLGPSRC